MARKPMFWGPSLFLSSGNWITWMSVCHIHIYTCICLTPSRIHGSPHEGSNWDMIEYEYLNRDSFVLSWAWYPANTNILTKQQAGPSTVRIWFCPRTTTTLIGSWPTTSQGFGQVYIWCRLTSKLFSSLMLRREMVLDTLVYLPFNHVMWQLVQEGNTEFSHSESFRLYIIITNLAQMHSI